jgi:hypothetical protein
MSSNTSETPLYKYLDFPELFYLLLNSKLFFCNTSELPDLNEMNFFSVKGLIDMIYLTNNIKDAHTQSDLLLPLKSFQTELKSNTYISCWSTKRDDYALWKIYTEGSKFGFCIETTLSDIIDSINSEYLTLFIHGEVKYGVSQKLYKQYREALISKNKSELIKILCFIKSKSYSYENEYRFAILKEHTCKTGIYQPVDLVKLIHKIHYSPFMPEWFKNIFDNIKETYLKRDIAANMKIFAPLGHLIKCFDTTNIKENL